MTDPSPQQLAVVELALQLHDRPLRLRTWCRSRETLPEPLTPLLRLLAPTREDEALLAGCMQHFDTSRERLIAAARFFVEQACLTANRDCYRILGVRPQATEAQIREHYRLLMRAFHPDRAAVSDVWTDGFAERVNQAYRMLRRPEDRARYDRGRSTPPTLDAAWGNGAMSPATGRPPRPPAARPPAPANPGRGRMPWVASGVIGGVLLAVLAGLGIQRVTETADAPSEATGTAAPADAAEARTAPIPQEREAPEEAAPPEAPPGTSPPRFTTLLLPLADSLRPPIEPRPAPATASPDRPPAAPSLTTDAIRTLMRQLRQSYENGDLAAFMRLFSDDARSDAGSGAGAIRRQYQVLFATTESRRLELSELRYRLRTGASAQVEGRFRIHLHDRGSRTGRVSRGTLSLAVTLHDDGQPRIVEFFHHGQ